MSLRSVIQVIKAIASTVLVALMLTGPAVISQPVAKFDNNYCCEFTTVNVPLLVTNFNNISSFTLYISFDEPALEFIDVVNPHPELSKGNFLWNFIQDTTSPPMLILSWIKFNGPIEIESGILFSLEFDYSDGEAFIGFTGNSEVSIDLIPHYGAIYKNGTVAPVKIISHPSDLIAAVNTQAVFSVSLNGEGNYQWQCNAGYGWEELADDDLFSGTFTNQLSISIANKDFDNHQFRCQVQVDECDFTSDEAILTVSLLNIDEKNSGYNILKVYPNPCSDVLCYSSSESMGNHSIELMNAIGEIVFQSYHSQQFEIPAGTIPLTGMPAGIYFLNLMDDTYMLKSFAKVIKQ